MRLVSWNVAGRVRRLDEQAAAIASEAPDLVALQEVSRTTLPRWRAAIGPMGLAHVCAAADLHPAPVRRRGLAVLLASRWPLAVLPGPEALPWPERALLARIDAGLVVCVAHSPISPAPDLAKVRTHEALHELLAAIAAEPVALCGDLNTPRREHPDGTVWTFARESRGALRPERGERWDAAEQALVRGLERFGYRDAFRTLHGYAERSATWAWPTGGGYRLDHLIVSARVEVERCEYRHEWRTDRLSDHSGLVADLAIVEP